MDWTNPVRERMSRGEPVFGATITVPSTDIAATLACANFDFLWFEMEHSPLTLESVRDMILATRGMPALPLVRLETSYVNLGSTGFGERWREGEAHSRAASFEQEQAFPISWWTTAGTLDDHPLRLRYQDLEPTAQYRVRLVYGDGKTKLRLVADGRYEIHPWMTRPSPAAPLEFDIPQEATADSNLELSFTGEPGLGGNGRGTDIAEIWLIRKK